MKNYQETAGGDFDYKGRIIPNASSNRDYQKMRSQEAKGDAIVHPYIDSTGELRNVKAAKKIEIADYFVMLALEDNLIVDIDQMLIIKLVYDAIPVPEPNPKCDRLFSNFEVGAAGYAQARNATTVAEVEAIDVPAAPWHRKP